VPGVDAPTQVAAVAVFVGVARCGGLGGGAEARLWRLAGAVLPPPSASAAAAAADGVDADAATDGDGAKEDEEEAGAVTDAVLPAGGVEWALDGWTVVHEDVAAPSIRAGAKARLAAAVEGFIVAVSPPPRPPAPAAGVQAGERPATDTNGEADRRVGVKPGGGSADAPADARADDAASVNSDAAPLAAAPGGTPPPPPRGYLPATEQAVRAVYAFDGASEERLRRALGAVAAAFVGVAAPPPAVAKAADDGDGGSGGADARSFLVDAAHLSWLLYIIGHRAVWQLARFEALGAAVAAAYRRRAAAAAAGGADDTAGGEPAPVPSPAPARVPRGPPCRRRRCVGVRHGRWWWGRRRRRRR